MKTISIEQVSNGWIVRPFSACSDWPVGHDDQSISVFTDIAAMQAALPAFFTTPDPLVPVRHQFGAADAPGRTHNAD